MTATPVPPAKSPWDCMSDQARKTETCANRRKSPGVARSCTLDRNTGFGRGEVWFCYTPAPEAQNARILTEDQCWIGNLYSNIDFWKVHCMNALDDLLGHGESFQLRYNGPKVGTRILMMIGTVALVVFGTMLPAVILIGLYLIIQPAGSEPLHRIGIAAMLLSAWIAVETIVWQLVNRGRKRIFVEDGRLILHLGGVSNEQVLLAPEPTQEIQADREIRVFKFTSPEFELEVRCRAETAARILRQSNSVTDTE